MNDCFNRQITNFDVDSEYSVYFEFGPEIYKCNNKGEIKWKFNKSALDLKYLNGYLYVYFGTKLHKFSADSGKLIDSIDFIEKNIGYNFGGGPFFYGNLLVINRIDSREKWVNIFNLLDSRTTNIELSNANKYLIQNDTNFNISFIQKPTGFPSDFNYDGQSGKIVIFSYSCSPIISKDCKKEIYEYWIYNKLDHKIHFFCNLNSMFNLTLGGGARFKFVNDTVAVCPILKQVKYKPIKESIIRIQFKEY